jgi:PAS domain S-box-containing protein
MEQRAHHTRRAAQQEAVAALGLRALAGLELEQLFEDAVRVTAEQVGNRPAILNELLPEERSFVTRAVVGIEGASAGETRVPVDGSLAGYTLSSNAPVVCHDVDEEDRFDPAPLKAFGLRSALHVVVPGSTRAFGALGIASAEPNAFDEEDVAFVQSVANIVGAAVERRRDEEHMAGERDRLEESEARFRELADNAPVMIWTTDPGGLVTFVNRGWLEFTGTTLDEELGETWTLGVHPDDADHVLDSWLEALAQREAWSLEYRLRRRDGEYRWIVDRGVPRWSEEGVFVGYVGTATDIDERKQMEQALRRVYEREHRVAETLQRSLLPEKLPEIEGVALAARYLPAGAGAAVGGDWYDAVELPDGRVALVVGDVVGHGLRAAAVMGQLRNALRAYSITGVAPAEILARLNRLVMTGGEQVMATLLYLALDRDTGEVRYSSAGHPPPLLLTPEGPRYLEGGRAVPIGAAELAAFREEIGRIPPGSTLLLYTDGLVERRDTPLDARFGQLAAAAAATSGDLDDLCDEILAGVLGGAEPADDVALLAVRPEPIDAERIELTLPAQPEALAGLRRRLIRFLHAAGASDEEAYEITLTISEAAGNAIEHAYGPGDEAFRVEAHLEHGVVVATVRDSGRWRDWRGEHRGRGLRIIESLMEDVEIVKESRGTTIRMRRRLAARIAA